MGFQKNTFSSNLAIYTSEILFGTHDFSDSSQTVGIQQRQQSDLKMRVALKDSNSERLLVIHSTAIT